MKKILLLCFALFSCAALQAQELPYSKYLDFSEEQFKEYNFKKVNGLNTAFNILAVIADASEDNQKSYVKVRFFNDDTYRKLLTFMKDNGKDMIETTSGKIVKNVDESYNEYEFTIWTSVEDLM